MQGNTHLSHSLAGLCSLDTLSDEPDNLKTILETIPCAVVLVDAQGGFLYVNKRGRQLYGIDYSGFGMEEHIKAVKALRLDGSPFPLDEMPVSKTLQSGHAVRNVEMFIQNANGVRYPVNVSASPLYDTDGKISGAIIIFEDFVERKHKAKEQLDAKEMVAQRARDKYRMLFNSIDQGFFLIDILFDENDKPVDLYYAEANAAAARMLGRDYTGRRLREIDPDCGEYWLGIFGKVALTGESVRMEQYADPANKWYSLYIFRIGDGKSRRVGNIFFDITANKLADKELSDARERLTQNTEEKYRMLFENMDEGFCAIDVIFDDAGRPVDWRYLETNPQFVHQSGLPDAAGRLVSELCPQTEASWYEFYGNVAASGVPARMENELKALDRWYDIYAFKVGGPQSRKVGALFRDVTKRKRAEDALRQSEAQAHRLAAELKKKNRLVTDFFINISHEFKTPLTILMLGLELLETKAKKMNDGGKAFVGNLTAMKQNAYRLNRLVGNLLDITKLDAGFMQPKWEQIDVAGMLRSLVQSVEPYTQQRQLSLAYLCDAAEILFTTDGFMLERIVLNLLSNAIKHTPAGGEIHLECRLQQEGIFVAVKDTGEGIPDDKRALIFDRFSQVDTKMTRSSEGTGIGLALTKSFVELLGGRITVESQLKAGSTFAVELPAVRQANGSGALKKGGLQIDKRVQMEFSDISLKSSR